MYNLNMKNKIRLGKFYTKDNFWMLRKVMELINSEIIIDPFAGEGDLLKHFNNVIGYDIDKSLKWRVNNSLKSIPYHKNAFIVTNPPYLSKSSASRKGIYQNNFGNHDNLYKQSLDVMIKSKIPGIAIVPESFIHSSFKMDYIHKIFILIPNPFKDTDVPVCIVYFDGNYSTNDVEIFINNKYKGKLYESKKILNQTLTEKNNAKISFTNCESYITFNSFDSTTGPGIKFVKNKNFKQSSQSRLVNAVYIDSAVDVNILNNKINYIRENFEFLIPPFNGNRNDGLRRRRMTFAMAKQIIRSI